MVRQSELLVKAIGDLAELCSPESTARVVSFRVLTTLSSNTYRRGVRCTLWAHP